MFLDSSVRSTRTISCLPRAVSRSALALLRTSAWRLLARSSSASTPKGCTATSVTWPRWLTRPAPGRVRVTSAPSTASQQSRNASAQLPGEETRVVGAEHPVEDRDGHVVRQQPEILGRRPRGVLEVGDPRGGVAVAQQPWRERQVVVLDQYPGPRCALVRERRRERLVVGDVGGPVGTERQCRTAAGSACRTAGGERTTGPSWRRGCTRRRTRRRGCRASGPGPRLGRSAPAPAGGRLPCRPR